MPSSAEKQKLWRIANKDKIRARMKIWNDLNFDKVEDYQKKWRDNNRGIRRASVVEYRLRKKQQMPIWADREAIKWFYILCPKGYQVDHIIPLKGKFISGLHVLNNLQYLPAAKNQSKNNRFNPD